MSDAPVDERLLADVIGGATAEHTRRLSLDITAQIRQKQIEPSNTQASNGQMACVRTARRLNNLRTCQSSICVPISLMA